MLLYFHLDVEFHFHTFNFEWQRVRYDAHVSRYYLSISKLVKIATTEKGKVDKIWTDFHKLEHFYTIKINALLLDIKSDLHHYNFNLFLFPTPWKRKSPWLVVGRSRMGKISESLKPQTKAIFYLELIPLQHIKSSGL